MVRVETLMLDLCFTPTKNGILSLTQLTLLRPLQNVLTQKKNGLFYKPHGQVTQYKRINIDFFQPPPHSSISLCSLGVSSRADVCTIDSYKLYMIIK